MQRKTNPVYQKIDISELTNIEEQMDDDDDAEEERLLAQLVHDISLGSPFRNPNVPLPYLTPPRRGFDEREADDDEALLARALMEEQVKGPEVLGAGLERLASERERILTDRFRVGSPAADKFKVGSPASPVVIRELFSRNEDEVNENEKLLEILRKASGETKGVRRQVMEETEARPREQTISINELKARIQQLEAHLEFERKRAEAALDREANLYAQRFVLAVICAASVPPLGIALLAHRYDLHEWEARSDALGVMLVVIIVLLFAAISLWRKARDQLVGEAPSQQRASAPSNISKVSSGTTDVSIAENTKAVGSAPGIRRRQRKFADSMRHQTKAEAVL